MADHVITNGIIQDGASTIEFDIGAKAENVSYDNQTNIKDKIDTKVDKVTGKGLSTNDYTDAEKLLVAKIPDKVDKVPGKGLSTNDYTDEEKAKLEGIEAGAQVNQDAFSHIKVGEDIINASEEDDTFELEAGTEIAINVDTENKKVTIASASEKMNKDGSNAKEVVNFPNTSQSIVMGDMEEDGASRTKVVTEIMSPFDGVTDQEQIITFTKPNIATYTGPLSIDATVNCFNKGSKSNFTSISTLPYDFFNGSAVVLNDIIYILGGSESSTTYKYIYRFINGVWTAFGTLPYNFYCGSAVILDGEIHILGGEGNRTAHYKLRKGTTSWVSVSTLPYKFSYGSVVVLDGEIHILGTFSDHGTEHYKYSNGEWVSVSTLPYNFYQGSAVVLNDEIHILGSTNSNSYTKHYKYSNGEWVEVSTLPYNFYGGSAVILNDEIHILGSTNSGNYTKHYKYSNGEWIEVSTLPYNFCYGSAVVLNNEIHILGSMISTYYKYHYSYISEYDSFISLKFPQKYGTALVIGTIYETTINLCDTLNAIPAIDNGKPTIYALKNNGLTNYFGKGNLEFSLDINAEDPDDISIENISERSVKDSELVFTKRMIGSRPGDNTIQKMPFNYFDTNLTLWGLECITPNVKVVTEYNETLQTFIHVAYDVKFRLTCKRALAANTAYNGTYYPMFILGPQNAPKNSNCLMTILENIENVKKANKSIIGPSSSGYNLDNSIVFGEKTISDGSNQIIGGQYNEYDLPVDINYGLQNSIRYNDNKLTLAIGNGQSETDRQNAFGVDTLGNLIFKKAPVWAQGRVNGTTIAESPYWYELEDGAAYMITFHSRINTSNAWRGAHCYMILTPWADVGAQTTAGGVGRATYITLGSSGTVGFTWNFVPIPYVYTDVGTGTTYQRFHTLLGVGSCATNIDTVFSIIKVTGSLEDFA